MLILLQLLWSWLEHNMVYGLGNKVHEGYAKRLVEHTAYVKRETLYEIL
jgi:ppGpp synthetase/RelA/SpoT-type nucleotidyltranferase